MKCPRCEADAAGKFCASCGASLQPTNCASCGAQPDPGDRFCNKCGAFLEGDAKANAGAGAAPAAGTGTTVNAGWLVAGGMAVVLVLAMAWPQISSSGGPAPVAPPQAPAAGGIASGASAVDLNAMTPREAADRLFTRVMRGVSSGNDAEVQSFLPMAIAAYDRALPLDADGLFHKSLLQMTAADPDAALATAEEGLASAPTHLLLLSAAAEAQTALGNEAEAAATYARILEAWESEIASGLADYEAHQQMMPEIESAARASAGG